MKCLKTIVRILINFLLAIIAGVGLLCLAFQLPDSGIEKHVAASAVTIQNEEPYPTISQAFSSTLDNYTDSIMLLEASDQTDTSVLKKAMAVYQGV